MIKKINGIIKIDTENTTLMISADKMPRIVYYGPRIADNSDFDWMWKRGKESFASSDDIDAFRSIISSSGDGHNRETMIHVVKNRDSAILRFELKEYEIKSEKPELTDLPSSYGEKECLKLVYTDENSAVVLEQYFAIFDHSDVIATSVRLKNIGNGKIHIKRIMSLQIDLGVGKYAVDSFDGACVRERIKHTHNLSEGTFSISSFGGFSSNTHNPYMCVKNCGRNKSVVSTNLIFSGNHKEIVDITPLGGSRIMSGMNDYLLDYPLESGEMFCAPEAIFAMAESEEKASQEMRHFVSEHIIRGEWKRKPRPILLNSWETFVFDFDKQKLMDLCDIASDCGIEMFVLDDGWFGNRHDDSSSLGDWEENVEKIGGTLGELSDSIKKKGLDFGIWVEPEMISRNSNLYKAHPEYAMKDGNREPIEIRHQLVLDITKPEVAEYVYDTVVNVIEKSGASYLKWDCNREIYELINSGTLFYDYMKSLYGILDRITKKYPHLLIESCASGGNRFDLGMLCYSPQIWTSDNTDARYRIAIQSGTISAYPQSTMGAHVSKSPSNHTFNSTSVDNLFAVAILGGAFGYEFNLTKLSDSELGSIKAQIVFYKKYRELLQFGDVAVNNMSDENGTITWTVTSKDKTIAIAVFLVLKDEINSVYPKMYIDGLKEEYVYSVDMKKQADDNRDISFEAQGKALKYAGIEVGNLFTESAVTYYSNSIQARIFILKKM